VYVLCRDNFRELKASLHASGRWRFGFTSEFVETRPDLIAQGKDRAWTKRRPSFEDPSRPVIGFQIVALKGGLYLGPEKRRSWPPSVVFIEPPEDYSRVTVVSVAIVQSRRPILISADSHAAVIAILPLREGWSVQVIASYEDLGTIEETITNAFEQAIIQMGGPDQVPEDGVFLVHGTRSDDIPWVSAVRWQKRGGGQNTEGREG
jgi:hypothetical protein